MGPGVAGRRAVLKTVPLLISTTYRRFNKPRYLVMVYHRDRSMRVGMIVRVITNLIVLG